jgi:hypothetical protein
MPLSQGFKLAGKRQVVREELRTARSHPPDNEVDAMVRRRLPFCAIRRTVGSETLAA